MLCDVGRGQVLIAGAELLQCNGTNATLPAPPFISLIGSTWNNSVTIRNSNLMVQLSGVSLSGPSPFTAIGSSLTIVVSGSNLIRSSAASHGAIECSDWSNLSLQSVPGGFLSVSGGSDSAAIGTSSPGSCDQISIVNGSYAATGATGIGTGLGNVEPSLLRSLTIFDGQITANRSSYGAAIGSGRGNSTVENLTLLNGRLIVSASYAAGIGSGSSGVLGRSTVVNLTIGGGTIQAAGLYGAAIGSGYGYQGTSSVNNVKIIDGNVNTTSSFSAGIHNFDSKNNRPILKWTRHWSRLVLQRGIGRGQHHDC
jgi:hypothetical protein